MFQNLFAGAKKNLNHEDRPKGAEPYIILLHYTGMQTALAALERLSDPSSKVSAHYLVDEDGKITKIVDESKRAWHAGVSYWAGEADINSYSIGIEIVNPGHEFGYRPFPQVQMDAVLRLCREIKARHGIRLVLAHSDVAPERKIDPGELFDWAFLAHHGVGSWPQVTQTDIDLARDVARNDYEVERLFIEFGYNPMAAFEDVVTAFHRHYYPQIFGDGKPERVCEQTVVRLLALIRQMRHDTDFS